jgi:hypothetical protein
MPVPSLPPAVLILVAEERRSDREHGVRERDQRVPVPVTLFASGTAASSRSLRRSARSRRSGRSSVHRHEDDHEGDNGDDHDCENVHGPSCCLGQGPVVVMAHAAGPPFGLARGRHAPLANQLDPSNSGSVVVGDTGIETVISNVASSGSRPRGAPLPPREQGTVANNDRGGLLAGCTPSREEGQTRVSPCQPTRRSSAALRARVTPPARARQCPHVMAPRGLTARPRRADCAHIAAASPFWR